jgi:hypothetical protein
MLLSIAAAAQGPVRPTREQAAGIFDAITRWRPIPIGSSSASDPISASFLSGFNSGNQRNVGYVLAQTIVPSLASEDRTESRGQAILALIAEAHVNTALAALPHFAFASNDVHSRIVQNIRRAIVGGTVDEVSSGSAAIENWADSVSKGSRTALPEELIELVISGIETRRTIGLHSLLHCARNLIELNRLEPNATTRLSRALGDLAIETAYERINPDSLEAVLIPLIRSECVRTARALQRHRTGGSDAKIWLDIAGKDPLPEVRFALTE